MDENINTLYYVTSMNILKSWLIDGVINEQDFIKMERVVSNKFDIKTTNVYRVNRLTNSSFRVMYMTSKKEE